MSHYIGIDLGTTFSAVAVIDATGRPKIMPNSRDKNITPSVVAKHKGALIVGEFARKHWGNDDTKGAARFKRDMGTSKMHAVDGTDFTPTELSAAVLKELRTQAESRVGVIAECVVTIPANFSNEARDATMEAARRAGLNVNYIVNEPTAAALYYAYQTDGGLSGKYVVFDLGGGTFDVSVIAVSGQDVQVLASNGLHKLGGADFDQSLWGLIAEKYEAVTDQELTTDEFSLNDAEDAKKSLSARKRTTVEIEREFIDISRIEFEEAISGMLAQIEMMCESTLDESGIDLEEVSEVFLAGGSTRMPSVLTLVEKAFKKSPISTENVDEVVALGAALYAAHKSDGEGLSELQKKSLDQLKVSERTSCYLGTISLGTSESKGEAMVNSILIKKGEAIPCQISESYFTVADGQASIRCSITESKSPETDPRFVKIIHEETLDLPPGRPKGQEIIVSYAYDENQIIHASFRDVASGNEAKIEIAASDKKRSASEIDKFLVE